MVGHQTERDSQRGKNTLVNMRGNLNQNKTGYHVIEYDYFSLSISGVPSLNKRSSHKFYKG